MSRNKILVRYFREDFSNLSIGVNKDLKYKFAEISGVIREI